MMFANTTRVAECWVWEGGKMVDVINYEFPGEKSLEDAQNELNMRDSEKEYQIMCYSGNQIWVDVPSEDVIKYIRIEGESDPTKREFVCTRRYASGFVWDKEKGFQRFTYMEIGNGTLSEIVKQLNKSNPDKMYTITAVKESKIIIYLSEDEIERYGVEIKGI